MKNQEGHTLQCSRFAPAQETDSCFLYLHGNSGSRLDGLGDAAELLLRYGTAVVVFDFAACGQSKGDFISLGVKEIADVDAVLRYVHHHYPFERLGIWGRSMGAVTAIRYACALQKARRAAAPKGVEPKQSPKSSSHGHTDPSAAQTSSVAGVSPSTTTRKDSAASMSSLGSSTLKTGKSLFSSALNFLPSSSSSSSVAGTGTGTGELQAEMNDPTTILKRPFLAPNISLMILDSPFSALWSLAQHVVDNIQMRGQWLISTVASMGLHVVRRSVLKALPEVDIKVINTRPSAEQLECPVVFVHGLKDEIVPFTQGLELFRAWGASCSDTKTSERNIKIPEKPCVISIGRKAFVAVDGTHNDMRPVELMDIVSMFVRQYFLGPKEREIYDLPARVLPMNGVPRAAFRPLLEKEELDLPKLPSGIIVFFMVRLLSMTRPRQEGRTGDETSTAKRDQSSGADESKTGSVEAGIKMRRGSGSSVETVKEAEKAGPSSPQHESTMSETHTASPQDPGTSTPQEKEVLEEPEELSILSPLSDGKVVLALHETQGLYFLRPYSWDQIYHFPFHAIERAGMIEDEGAHAFYFSSYEKVEAFERPEQDLVEGTGNEGKREVETTQSDDEETSTTATSTEGQAATMEGGGHLLYYMFHTYEAPLISAVFDQMVDTMVKQRMQGADGKVDAMQVLANLQQAVEILVSKQLSLQKKQHPEDPASSVVSDEVAQQLALSLTGTMASVLCEQTKEFSYSQIEGMVQTCVAATCAKLCGRRPTLVPRGEPSPLNPPPNRKKDRNGACIVS